MARLMRLHFASIGHRDARLSPLTLDLREHGRGTGTDTVLWLRNGGGKSSILNLFFSLMRPGARDFLGTAAEGKTRRLADYVKDNDLAFVVSEWDLAPQVDLFDSTPRHVHVLGQMLSWKGLQRSPDESRLRKLLFGFRANAGLGFDDLPIRGLAEPVASFEAFRDWLTAQKSRDPALEVIHTDAASTWRTYLGQLGLDPDLMKVQIQMNTREGAADESFRFKHASDFVDFFLELAMDLDKATELSANLETFRSRLQQRPVLLLERKLFDAVLPPLRDLAAAVDTQAAARRYLVETTEIAAGTVAGLRQRSASFERRAADRRGALKVAQELAQAAYNDGSSKRRWAYGVECLAVRLRKKEAADALAEALAHKQRSQRNLDTVRAAETLGQVESLDAQVAAKKIALDRSMQELVPLREKLDRAGSGLRVALRRSDDLIAGHERDARAHLQDCKASEKSLREEKSRGDIRTGSLNAEIQTRRQRLKERDAARETLTQARTLDSYEKADDALLRWQEAAAAAAARAESAGQRREERILERKRLAAELGPRAQERGQIEVRIEGARNELKQALAWRDQLRRTPILCELQGVDEADLEQPRLEHLLRQQAEDARRRILALGVDAAEDERALVALRNDGFLPPSRDVEEAVRLLQGRKVHAHAGLRYLADNNPAADSRARTHEDPARHAGVVVMRKEDLDIARTLAASDTRLRTPVQVSWVRDEQPAIAPACVLPPDPALYDRHAADQRRHELTMASETRQREVEDLRGHEQTCNIAAGELARYLSTWGAGKLEHLEALLNSLIRHEQQLAARIAETQQRIHDLDEQIQSLADEQKTAEKEAGTARKQADRVAGFIEQFDRHFSTWNDELARLQRESDALARRLEQLASEIEQAAERTLAAQVRLDGLARDRAALRVRIDAIVYAAASEPDDVPALAEAEALYDSLRATYEQKTSENRLQWEIEHLQKDLLGARSKLAEQLRRGLEESEVRQALARGDLPGQLARGQEVLDEAITRHAAADHTYKLADRAVAELQRKREADDLPSDRPQPTISADADRLATQLHEESQAAFARQEEKRTEAQEHEAAAMQLDARRATCTHLLELLSAVAGALSERPPRELPEADADLRARIDELCTNLKHAEAAEKRATEAVRAGVDIVRGIASEERFTELKHQARDRLRSDVAELAARAAEFVDEFTKAQEILDHAIAELDDHRRILIGNLVGLGEDAASLLRQAARASLLPETLGPWGGRSYLKIDFQIPDNDAERQARIAPLIDRLMDSSTVPNALGLVRQAIFELAGGRHDAFKVTVLKPDAVLRPDPIAIELLSTFSRGQQLTAAILLYCTIVQIRARRRGRGRAVADAGALILDNPIGTCSSRALLEMQRMIAQKMGVQLVYTTGVEDADAIAVLPNTIRLRNSHRDRRTGDLHVTDDIDAVEGVRIQARLA